MREYLRQEKIAFRFGPQFFWTRLLFIAVMLLIPSAQAFIMIVASSFSYGFRFETEEEHVLPLTDEEIKKNRLIRVNMIWLRYLIIGLASTAMMYLLKDKLLTMGGLFKCPVIYAAFFVLQMAMIYEMLLERATEYSKSEKKPLPFRFFFNSLPLITLFSYAFAGLAINSHVPFFMEGAEWIHVSVLLVMAAFTVFYAVTLCRTWKLLDIRPDSARVVKND